MQERATRLVILLALASHCDLAAAQLQPGDILVTTSGSVSGEEELIHLAPDGTLIGRTSAGTGGNWFGVGSTPSGDVLVSRLAAGSFGVNVLDGATLMETDTWDGTGLLGDVEVFVDGLIAAAGDAGQIDLYSQDGTPQGSWSHPQLSTVWGLGLDPGGDLWAVDFGILSGRAVRFDHTGTAVNWFDTVFPALDLVVDTDGTIWLLTGQALTKVHHYAPDGTSLGEFSTVVPTGLPMGIALGGDGTLWLSGNGSDNLYQYSNAGALLATVPLGASSGPALLHVVGGNLTGGTTFCVGDGSGAPCPCANSGAQDSGCGNGTFADGCELTASGNASVAADTLTLSVLRSTPGQPGLFFQGDAALNNGDGVPFGDGLRCAGTHVVRLEVSVAAGGAASSTVGIADLAGLSPGDVRRYQWWYRDPSGSPCGAQFNLSNGVALTWAP